MTCLVRYPVVLIGCMLSIVFGCGGPDPEERSSEETLSAHPVVSRSDIISPKAPQSPPENAVERHEDTGSATADDVPKNGNSDDTDVSDDSDVSRAETKQGTVCIAPIDIFKGDGPRPNIALDPWRGGAAKGRDSHRTVYVSCAEQQIEVTEKKGGRLTGLSLDDVHTLVLREKGIPQPYTRIRANFKKMNSDVLCLYNNAFYGTTQISEKARRRYCKKCFAESGNETR